MAIVVIVVAAATLWRSRVAQAQVQSEVRGRVTGSGDGAAISSATIADAEGELATRSDGSGEFVLRGLTPGVHRLRVAAVGFQPTLVTVVVANGRTTDATVVLDPAITRLAPVAVEATPDRSPPGATIITRAGIEASGRRDLADVLDAVPAVVVTRRGGPAGPATISIRGSSADEVLVLVDGVPVNSRLTGSADLSGIPLASIERITVLPGAQSARYGSRALAGVVLIETRQAAGPAIDAQASAGAWGDRDAAVSLGAGAATGVSGRVTGERRTSTGDFPFDQLAVRGGGTGVRRNDDAGASSINGTMRIPVGPLSLALRASELDDERGLPSSIVTPDTTARQRGERTSAGLTLTQDHARVSWTVDADVDRQHETDRDPTPTTGPAYDDHIDASTADARAAASIAPPGLLRGASLSIGGEARVLHVAATVLSDSTPPTEDEDGIWTSLRVSRPLGPIAVTLDADVRVDWATRVAGATASPHGVLAVADGPLVASVSGGQAFSPPTLADEFFHEGVQVKPNPGLRPERVRDEVEARLALHDVGWRALRVSAEAAVYRADIDGMILWFPNFAFVWSPSNSDVHREGWDGGGEIALPGPGVVLHGSVSDVAIEYAGPALTGQVAYRPRTSGDAGARVTRGRVTVDWTSRYIGERRTVQGSAINSLSSYWISDLHATVRVIGGGWPVDVFGGVDDLLDRRADLLVDYPYAGRTWLVGLRVRSPGVGRL
jgi:outer membrane cobalamin receptor